MTLDPHQRAAWTGLTDLLRPPPGYQLEAAVGTTFGLSFDALVAGLLALTGYDADLLLKDPLAGLMAVTRMSKRVRIFVHAGSISGAPNGIPVRLATLLDRLIIPVRPKVGLFHPKFWVVRHSSMTSRGKTPDRVRIVLGSRNLVASQAFELGAVIDGVVGDSTSEFGTEVAKALESCFHFAPPSCKSAQELPSLLRHVEFAVPEEGRNKCELLWQSHKGTPHIASLPAKRKRALVLSPFLGGDFLNSVLERTTILCVVSTQEAFRKLNDATFAALTARAATQRSPVMYVVGDELLGKDSSEDEMERLEGLHAKMLVADDGEDTRSCTFLGSANATGPGWGANGMRNVECLLHLRPGISMNRFIKEFVRERPDTPRPWIQEFDPQDRLTPPLDEERQDRLRSAVRDMAARRFIVTYDASRELLTVSCPELQDATMADGIEYEFTPLATFDTEPRWESLSRLRLGSVSFPVPDVSLVSGFVVLRATSGDQPPVLRIALAEVKMPPAEIEARDDAARRQLTAGISSEQILQALIFGLGYARPAGRTGPDGKQAVSPESSGYGAALKRVSLERLLQALATNPSLLLEMELLLGQRKDDLYTRFRDDLSALLRPAGSLRQ